MSLSRRIEEYIKSMLANHDAIELQRNELAESFSCVPSQINYVISTRFTPAQGYFVESRRGGGGYIRIIKLKWERTPDDILKELYQNLGEQINQNETEGVLRRLTEEGFITSREYYILKAVTSRETLCIDLPDRDIIRANILRAALAGICRKI